MKKRGWVIVSLIVSGFMGLAATGLLIVQLNPQLAADFTDNVLRPLVGNRVVVYLEKLVYNTSDKVAQLQAQNTTVQPPDFLATGAAVTNDTAKSQLNLNPLVVNSSFKRLADEGVWHDLPVATFPGQVVMAHTFLRPDPKRPYALVNVVQVDLKNLHLGAVAGIKQPGGSLGHPGSGAMPATILKARRVAAAFNGGFLYADGHYGMMVGHTTYAPLKKDTGTLVGYTNGDVAIVNYTGQDLGPDVAFARQNCPMLIDNGTIVPLNDKNLSWGRTITSGTYTWRSGVGITATGNLVYAAGNNLTPVTLAYALQAAGAVNAMQLDINPAWVSFEIFTPTTSGTYATTPLTKDMRNRAKQFLQEYNKDFFYLYTGAPENPTT